MVTMTVVVNKNLRPLVGPTVEDIFRQVRVLSGREEEPARQRICTSCKKAFSPEQIKEDHKHLFALADCFGMEALTESEQALVEGSLCSDCHWVMM